MNKIKLSIIAVLVMATLIGTVGMVSAQTATPPTPADGTGFGFRGGRGSQTGMWNANHQGLGSGLLHDVILPIVADKLGLTVDELNTRLDAGETLGQIAFPLDWTLDDFRALMLDARSQALDEQVEDGTITREQADWMQERGAGQMMGRGRGMGQRQNANPDCPYYQTNP